MRLQGSVSIQVLIDESGKVVSAKALSGHQVLVNAAESAAMQARFSPTLLSNQPVKVSGVIIYNFVLP
jgi:TonB family protein